MTKFTKEEFAYDILHYMNKTANKPVDDRKLDDMAQELKRTGRPVLSWMWAVVQHLD